MTRTTRRLIFYIFVAVFVFTTPPTILYATGYSFDWDKKTVVQNGGIFLKSSPNNAQIIINGKIKGYTKKLVSRLTPQVYHVAISKDDFFTWEKSLEVLPGIVTEARSIFLFPKNINAELLARNVTSTIPDYLLSASEKQNQARAKEIASSTAGWFLKNDAVFYISLTNYALYRENLNGLTKEQISKDFLPAANYKIISSDGRQFLILAKNGDLYYINGTNGIFNKMAQEVKDAQFSGDNKKFLYLTNNEIWVHYLQEIQLQPYKKSGDKELITRYAQKIKQAIFYPDSEHVAFAVGDQIKATELDGRDKRNTVDLISAPSPQIYFTPESSYLYYLSEEQLFGIQLTD